MTFFELEPFLTELLEEDEIVKELNGGKLLCLRNRYKNGSDWLLFNQADGAVTEVGLSAVSLDQLLGNQKPSFIKAYSSNSCTLSPVDYVGVVPLSDGWRYFCILAQQPDPWEV